jgi:NADPH2:quinone reductase
LPAVPGAEGAGVVQLTGKGVKGFKPGDRVAYATAPGAYASERNIPADKLVPLPDAIDYETAAAIMLKGLTSQYLLCQSFPIQRGHTVLIHAAAGGVGLIACQWANHLGATVIGTAGSAEKAKLASEHGCHHVIRYSDENFVERVNEITGGKKCDVVYDGVGKATFPASLDCLKPRGMFVSFGNASGAVDAFNILTLAAKGSLYCTRPTLAHFATTAETTRAMAASLFALVESGAVKVLVRQRYPLADAARAHAELEARQTTGSSVLLP